MDTMFAPRKKIFMGLQGHVASFWLTANLHEGLELNLPFRFDRTTDWLRGSIVTLFRHNDGILVLVKNSGYRESPPYGDSVCPGWRIVPLWLSRYGQSGILTTWKEGDVGIRDIVNFFVDLTEQQAINCMAL